MRLDQYIPGQDASLSRSFIRRLVDIGGVHVQGRRVRKCSHVVQTGETVEVHWDGLPLTPFSLTEEHIVFRDRYLLAVNKPACLDIQPTPSRYKGTLYEALLRFLQNPYRPLDRPSLGMVQRLDRDTSGIVIFSIHPRAHRGLTAAFTERQVEKRYLALVNGVPRNGNGELRSHLARDRYHNRMKSVPKGGKEAITRFRVIEDFGVAALLEVEILTGRSHQIRAHCAEAGHPLLGDTLYGGPCEILGCGIARQMLHSWQLTLTHPVLETPLSLEVKPPEDFEQICNLLRDRNG
ncbi:MAG TPA: RluA family pseudouridine synthase [Desulfuromonadales bacterium]|nr:RluA family pseudouridine synthase [Desulfuromonadales bacterium]